MKQVARSTSIAFATLLFVATYTTPSFACNVGELCGSVAVGNSDCTRGTENEVRVHIYPDIPTHDALSFPDCTRDWYTIPIGHGKTVKLKGKYNDGMGRTRTCHYIVEAEGTVGSSTRVDGDWVSSVTCKKDGVGICQCTKN